MQHALASVLAYNSTTLFALLNKKFIQAKKMPMVSHTVTPLIPHILRRLSTMLAGRTVEIPPKHDFAPHLQRLLKQKHAQRQRSQDSSRQSHPRHVEALESKQGRGTA